MPRLQIHEQPHHLRLQRHVQAGKRFIHDEQFGFCSHGASQRQPLPLSAAELAWPDAMPKRDQGQLLPSIASPVRCALLRISIANLQRLLHNLPRA